MSAYSAARFAFCSSTSARRASTWRRAASFSAPFCSATEARAAAACARSKARCARSDSRCAAVVPVEPPLSFELDPNRAKEDTGLVIPMLASKYGMSEEQVRQAEARVAANVRSAGLEYLAEGRDHGNTFDIHRLLHFAKEQGKQGAM